MKVAAPLLTPLLRSDVQGRLLANVFAAPEDEHSVTDLAARAKTSLTTALREVERAEAAGIVATRRVGNTRLVRADDRNPLFAPYRQILLATYGPPAILRQEFAEIAAIEGLFIFGSWAARYAGVPGPPPNDIDVMVVGKPNRAEVHDAAERAELRIGLPVQTTIRSLDTWRGQSDPFIGEVRSRPIVPAIGDVE